MAEETTNSEATGIPKLPNLQKDDHHSSPSNVDSIFFTIPQELRDQIYDDVAIAETEIGLKVTLRSHAAPELDAYSVKGLGQTCKQIGKEYLNRLQHLIKDLLTETPVHDHTAKTCCSERSEYYLLWCCAKPERQLPFGFPVLSRIVRVADRKVSKGFFVKEDVAVTMRIPFSGNFDHGLPVSNLAFTLSSNVDGAYNHRCLIDHSYHIDEQKTYWKKKGQFQTLWHAVSQLAELLKRTDWDGSEHWWRLWWKHQLVYDCRDDNAGLKDGSDWLTFLGRVCVMVFVCVANQVRYGETWALRFCGGGSFAISAREGRIEDCCPRHLCSKSKVGSFGWTYPSCTSIVAVLQL